MNQQYHFDASGNYHTVYYSDIVRTSWRRKSPATWLFFWKLSHADSKQNNAFSCRHYTHILLTHPPSCRIYASVNWVSIGSDNGLSPIRRQAIIQTNADLLAIGPLRINFREILIKIQIFSFTKMHMKISSAKWRPFCPGFDTGAIRCFLIRLPEF